MYIIFFKREDLDKFLQRTNSSRLDESPIHHNLINILQCIPGSNDKFNEKELREKLKFHLRNYRFMVIEDLNTINQLDYALATKVADNFPYESVLNKKYIERDKEKIIIYKDEIWHLVEQIQMQMNQTQVPSTHKEKAEDTNNIDTSGIGSTIINWFSSCSSNLFFNSPTRDGYQSVELQELGLNARPPEQIKSFNNK